MNGITEVSLSAVLGLISTGVGIFGSIMLLWGLVGVGLSLKDGQGMSMDANVGKLVGGAIIVAGAAAFNLIASA